MPPALGAFGPKPRAGPPALHPGALPPTPQQELRPCTRPPFLCSAKEKGGKERRACCARPLACPSGFPAASASGFPGRFECSTRGHAQNSLRSLRSLRSDKLRESDHDVRLRRTAPLSALLGGADGGQQPTAEPRAVDCRQRADVRYSAVRSPTPSAPPRSTASRPACRGHATPLTRPACLSRVSEANAASSGRGRLASTAGNPSPQARGERSAGPPFFSPLFFGGAKKRGPGAGPEVLLRGPGAEGPRMGCTA
jgi:hypothetical protein